MSQEASHRQLILAMLKTRSPESVPGPFLSSHFGLSRTAVWKHIQKLRSLGYDISSHPKKGYRLLSAPDSLIPEEIVPALATAWLGRSYVHIPETTSTNDLALSMARQGAPHGSVFVAEHQTAGRGRLQRAWQSASGKGIYLTLLLRDPLPTRQAPQITLVAALSLAHAVHSSHQLPALIKWPNDLLIHGKKIAGILTEMQSDHDSVSFLVVGVGVNANHDPADFGPPLSYPATSLAIELGAQVKRQHLLLAFLHRFEQDYERYLARGIGPMLPELHALSAVLNKHVTIHCASRELTGIAVGFTPEGGLIVATEEGKEEVVWVGDVTRVRDL